jgi:hypothetical protein
MYAWPQNIEEVVDCLTDALRPREGGPVCTAKLETGTMWEVCSIGQSQFLHQIGHAFGAGHTTGIMSGRGCEGGGCAGHWPRNFIARTAAAAAWSDSSSQADGGGGREGGGLVVDDSATTATTTAANEGAVFDLRDLLAFKQLPHFWVPDDVRLLDADPPVIRLADLAVCVDYTDDDTGNTEPQVMCYCPAQIMRVPWNGEPSQAPSLTSPMRGVRLPLPWIENTYPRDRPVRLEFLGGNGRERVAPRT